MAAYEQADFEETGEHCEYLIVVNVPRSRPHKVTYKVFKRTKTGLNKFLRVRAAFDDDAELAKRTEGQQMDGKLELASQHLTEKCAADTGSQCNTCDELIKLFGRDEWVLAYVDAKYETEEQNG